MIKNIILSFSMIVICLFSLGEAKMDILYKLELPPDELTIYNMPEIYPILKGHRTGMSMNVKIFPLPIDKVVGTVDVDYSSITEIQFKRNNELGYKRLKRRNDLDIMDGGFVSQQNNKTIGYFQGRSFVLYNLLSNKIIEADVCDVFEENIADDKCINEKSMIFAFEVTHDGGNGFIPPDHLKDATAEWGYTFFRTIDLSNGKPKVIASKCIDSNEKTGASLWDVNDGMILYFSNPKNIIMVFDSQLKQATHPFAELVNKLSLAQTRVTNFAIHPNLPFAFFMVYCSIPGASIVPDNWLAIWRDGKEKSIPLMYDNPNLWINSISFSPDNKWVVLNVTQNDEKSGKNTQHFYYLKIDPKNPIYIEPPKYLGKIVVDGAELNSTAWTTNPTAFVACDGKILYRWNFDKVEKGQPTYK